MNPRDLTTEQIRDRLAELDGWVRPGTEVPGWVTSWGWRTVEGKASRFLPPLVHPHPATLDGADAAMPPGKRWERENNLHWQVGWMYRLWIEAPEEVGGWRIVSGKDGGAIITPDTGDPIHDLYLLALLAREAQ